MKTGLEFRAGTAGLGPVGMGAALSCICTGLSTWGANLNSNACATLREAGAHGASGSIVTSAEKLDALLMLVVNATQVKQVLSGEKGITQHLKPGTAVVVSSIITSVDAQEIAIAPVGFGPGMLDASVSGDTVKAIDGEMTVMAFGSDTAFERLTPVLKAIVGKVCHIGSEPGLSSTVKIIHRLLAGVHIAAGTEAIALVARAGIPLDVMYDAVTNVAGNPWMFESRMCHVVDGNYIPYSAIDIFVEDLGLAADTAKALYFPLPLVSAALNILTSASNAGYGKEDDSVVIKIFSGITLPGAKS